MFANLAWGSLLIAVNVLVQTAGLFVISKSMPMIIEQLKLHRHAIGKTVALVATVFGLFLIHTIQVWGWATLFVAIGAIGGFENALYLSTATFSTVGSAPDIIDPSWRLLASLEGVNGFLMIGWSIAFLVGASTRYGPFRSGENY